MILARSDTGDTAMSWSAGMIMTNDEMSLMLRRNAIMKKTVTEALAARALMPASTRFCSDGCGQNR